MERKVSRRSLLKLPLARENKKRVTGIDESASNGLHGTRIRKLPRICKKWLPSDKHTTLVCPRRRRGTHSDDQRTNGPVNAYLRSAAFTIYGPGGHLGHVTWIIYINIDYPIL